MTPDTPVAGAALLEFWRGKISPGEREILEAVVAVFPNDIEREEISTTTEYQKSSRNTYIQKLCARELLKASGRGRVRASDLLFDSNARKEDRPEA